jgi:hypothetical protein
VSLTAYRLFVFEPSCLRPFLKVAAALLSRPFDKWNDEFPNGWRNGFFSFVMSQGRGIRACKKWPSLRSTH